MFIRSHPVPSLVLVSMLLLVGGLAACGSEDENESESGATASIEPPSSCDPSPGGSIVIALNEELPTFDSSQNPVVGPTAFTLTPLVFDRLVRTSSDLSELEPQLATSVEANDDFTQWTINLREGVTFHDGSKLDADDVAFSLNYTLNGFNGFVLGPVDKITAVDPQTVRVDMTDPYAQLELQGLASWPGGFIYPDDFGGEEPEDFFADPVGTGPYEMTSLEPTSGVKLAANADYWGDGGPYIDEIEARFVPDANERVLGLESGDFAFIDRLPGDQVDNLPDGSVARVIDPSAANDVLNLSSVVDLFTDPKVREAISLALNREEIADGAYAGYADVADTTLPPALPNVPDPEVNPYEYDLERAQELMAESSFPDGGEEELTYIRGDANTELEAQLVQEDLSKIGIEVGLGPVSSNEYFDLASEGQRRFTLFNNSAISPDPIDFVGFYAVSGGYYGEWPTGKVQGIVDSLSQTDDPAQTEELYSEFENYIVGVKSQIPTVSSKFLNAHSSDLGGLVIDPLNEARFGDAWLCTT